VYTLITAVVRCQGSASSIRPVYHRRNANGVPESEVSLVQVPIWMQCLNTTYAGNRNPRFQIVCSHWADSVNAVS
jgi:hypothetical protein